MKALRLALGVCILAVAWGCEKKPAESAPAEEARDVDVVVEREGERAREVYRKAYEKAKRDITADNVHDRLSALESEVERGRAALE